MSVAKPSGLKVPGTGSKLARPAGGIPQKSGLVPPGSLSRAHNAIAKSARAAGLNSSLAESYATQALAGEEELNAPPPPADDFIIGDRVFVSGSKPGYIAFIGETQFAPGDWAGVVLDEMIGKNDGAVNGVRYFQCEAKRGVFCRLSKLSRTPEITGAHRKSEDATSERSVPMNGDEHNAGLRRPTTPSLLQRPSTPSRGRESGIARPTTPSLHRPVHKSLSSSNSSLSKGPVPLKARPEPVTSTPMAAPGAKVALKVGDRVLVSGSKLGTLRYLGPADFAKGDWVGVELDDPVGKNDGAVAGKRYFDCQPRYGLFAPVHKVTKTTAQTTPVSSLMTRSMGSTGLRPSREHSGSQESVSSLSSATSSASRPRPTPGSRTGQRPGSLNITATTSALQKALKEKEEHIEQLLRERDLERSEVARAAAQVDEAQGQLTHIKVEKERLQEESEENIQHLRSTIQSLLSEKHELVLRLEDEKRKVEDLQFQIEEEVISKDDLESKTEAEEARVRELEKNLKRERERAEKLETEVISLKMMTDKHEAELREMEETQTSYLDQIEELTHKLSQAETRIQEQDESRLEEGAKTSQVSIELEEKAARVSELEDYLAMKNREVKQLQEKLAEMKDELETRGAKFDKLQHSFDELNEKLKVGETKSNDLTSQVQSLKSQNADIQRQLTSSEERANQIVEEKKQLELQVAEMMKNTGDNSHQLSMLNEQLSQKTRKLEELQGDLLTSTQKWHSLNDQHESAMRAKGRELEMLQQKHTEVQSSLAGELEDLKKELEKSKAKLVLLDKDFESEKGELVKRKDNEIHELKQHLEAAQNNASQQEIQTQAHKQVLDKLNLEKEAIEFEREKLEKQLKRLENERDTAHGELITARVEAVRAEENYNTAIQEKQKITYELTDMTEEKERLEKQLTELTGRQEVVLSDKEKLNSERDTLQKEAMEHRAAIQQRDMLVEELQRELEKLRTETSQQQSTISSLSQQTSDSGQLQKTLCEQQITIETLRKQMKEKEDAVTQCKKSFDQREEKLKEMKIELEDSQETVTLLEENLKDLERERDSLTSKLQEAFAERKEQDMVLELNKKLNEEIETIKQRHRTEMETMRSLHTDLQEEIDNSSSLLQQKDSNIHRHLAQISNLEKENALLMGYKSASENKESEMSELRDKVNKLQTKLNQSQTNANIINNKEAVLNSTEGSNDFMVKKLKEECEVAQGQVVFLNSVIVDLQKKKEELQTRLEAMENGVHNGHEDPQTPSRHVAVRMFCDICDVFDSHETEDCPKQEMMDSPPPSQFHGDRHQVRPYCDICEEFHPPCPVLSKKKILETGAEPIDSTTLVEHWVKQVDSLTSEMVSESEKVFGNDGEFFYVQSDAGFRDSGYYDGVLDSKLPVVKSSMTATKAHLSDAETDEIIADISEKHKAALRSKISSKGMENHNEENDIVGKHVEDTNNHKRPQSLEQVSFSHNKSVSLNNQYSRQTPASLKSPSDSEYLSGQESLGSSGSESPIVAKATSEMESSVDTGEVFESDSPVESAPKPSGDVMSSSFDKAAENCVIS
ncbi:CAP-Gly domain-containing linker protein 1-like isoform X2 [Dreissena polymorpha]|uniref:CAP-Gly domain-containing linker protein 1-like isoform X2 n=1 Tax=Dreissena polymorpha TaxID=45954 RepID=UPI0022641F25|nr:CAP-Gly domain-containing linker protein 1-like isoform X2 [Dreissena polymorpha]